MLSWCLLQRQSEWRRRIRHETHALSPDAVWADAAGEDAVGAQHVSTWACTPLCNEHSACNQFKSEQKQIIAWSKFSRMLEYVRQGHPDVVLVENVLDGDSVAQISALAVRIEGYDWRFVESAPCMHAGVPVSRFRGIWVGTRRGAHGVG